MNDPIQKTIRVKSLTRVEGEGALHIRLAENQPPEVRLNIFEPPRFFEALLRGRPLEDVPDITARICGICPIAYQLTSVQALEKALGIRVPDAIRRLRDLLYCGEWIESHGIHMHLLQIPDFFNCGSAMELAKTHAKEVQRGLRLKQIGNRLIEVLGGRATHPVNVAVGGFHRTPQRIELMAMRDELLEGLEAAVNTTRWVNEFDFPEFQYDYRFVALNHSASYAINEGELVVAQAETHTGALNLVKRFTPDQFDQHIREQQVPHSTALQSRLEDGQSYLVGPLARLNINREQLAPISRQLLSDAGLPSPCTNPFQSIIARALEVVHAFETAISIIDELERRLPARTTYTPCAGKGTWVTEAPRGMIYHSYETDAAGRIKHASIVPPTSQNQSQIEMDIARLLPSLLTEGEHATAEQCERLVRAYDPCISCATHFLKVHIERD